MDVVSPELNSLLPDEIMDTEAIAMEEELPTEHLAAPPQTEPESPQVPMETEVPEIVSLCPATTTMQMTSSDAQSSISSGTQLLLTPSGLIAATTTTTTTSAKTTSPAVTQNLAKISSVTVPANHQLIINKVAGTPTADGKSPGAAVLKPEGQKLLVAGLSKTGQPIMLALPHTWNKPATTQGAGDGKAQPTQIKMVTTVGKPVIAVSSASQLMGTSTTLQAQQLKTLQLTKKPPVSTAGPMITKLIITKALNNKGLSSPASVAPVVTGRVVTQSTPVTPPRSITIGETISTVPQNTSGNSKVAISPLKSPSKLTVVSVASQSPNSPQKSVTLPLNVALGQQILTVQQSAATSPAKAGTSQSTAQAVKPVQTVGGVGTPQFKTIIPLTTPPNVQQIQVPGSRFHYVRLVTATTGSSTAQSGSSTNTNPSIQPAKPVMMNAAVRMSVPIVQAQTVKQVVPKPLTSAAQVVTTSQTPQRLIMPATHLPQIQPNLTNLPPGTVLAPAHGSGNMGYAVLPAPYVTQIPQPAFVTLTSSSTFSTATPIQTQARLSLNGLSTSEATSRPRKPCNCTRSQCLKLYCDCFANGEFCNNCNCVNCFNNLDHESERLKAIKACLDRNPVAFKPKIGKGKEGESDRRHSKGCNCKKSGCLKNYCECYEAKIMCSSICKCMGCKNFEESPERKTLMHLADAAEVRVQQQTAAKTKLSSQISDLLTRTTPAITSGGGKLPYTFVTKEVAEATCDCLLEQAEQAELANQPQAMAERLILEEFGRCLRRIISFAGKAKTDCPINC
ncbi:protein lin-54 homolog [Garra rufa]|uniref:protein lin-54 homolog n=1 Tax=Garra rufa TaxID=137080 RepID=UPI003CCE731C